MSATISDVYAEDIEGAKRRKLVVAFRELEKPLVLNSTNTRYLVELFGTSDTSAWKGGRITLYVQDDIEFAGTKVGGIRIQAAPPCFGRHRRDQLG